MITLFAIDCVAGVLIVAAAARPHIGTMWRHDRLNANNSARGVSLELRLRYWNNCGECWNPDLVTMILGASCRLFYLREGFTVLVLVIFEKISRPYLLK